MIEINLRFRQFYSSFKERKEIFQAIMETRKKISDQIGDFRSNLIKLIQDLNAMKMENEKLTKLLANDDHKRKLEVLLNDCREKMHKFQSESLQKDVVIGDLEMQISQIQAKKDELIKERDATIAEISENFSNKTAEYEAICEKLAEVQSTAELFGELNEKLKIEHETNVENLKLEIEKLKRDGSHFISLLRSKHHTNNKYRDIFV